MGTGDFNNDTFAEVQIEVHRFRNQKDRIVINAENFGERYVMRRERAVTPLPSRGQRLALIKLYKSTGGASWIRQDGWRAPDSHHYVDRKRRVYSRSAAD